MELKNIVIISGPSGAGEDSVMEGVADLVQVNRVINTTTRPARRGEVNGQDYYFVSHNEFEEKVKLGAMAEWAQEYNDYLYGVTNEELARVENLEGLGLWKMEYKGVRAMREKFPNVTSILIHAPLDVLESRIRKRDEVTEEHVHTRMAYTQEWYTHLDIYDYVVENKEGMLAETISEVMDILRKEQYL